MAFEAHRWRSNRTARSAIVYIHIFVVNQTIFFIEHHIYFENVNTFLGEPLSAESPVQRRADTAGNVPPTTQKRRPRQSHLAFADAVFCYAFGIAPIAGGFFTRGGWPPAR